MAILTRTKAAWIRDANAPAGSPAPGYFVCNCQTHLPAEYNGAGVTCPNCGLVFDGRGWIQNLPEAQ